MADSVWPHRWQPTRFLHPWDSPGKNTGVGCHFLLLIQLVDAIKFQQNYSNPQRMMPSRFCIYYVSKSGRPRSSHRTGKRSILILVPKNGSTKECANHRTVALISHASMAMLKSCIPSFSIMWTKNFQMPNLGLVKEGKLEVKLPTFAGL